MDFERSLLQQNILENGNFAAYLTISLGCHIILMVFLIMTSGFSGCERRTFTSRVIDVDLVSLPDASGAGMRAAESRLSQPAPKSVSAPSQPVTALAVDKPVDRVKTALKEKTFNAGQSVEKAVARLEKQAEQQAAAPDSGARTSSRPTQAEPAGGQSVTVSGPGLGPGGGSAGGRSRQELEAIEIYKLEIRYHILNNWVFSSQLAGTDKDLKAVIGITIAADGRITETWFDRRSGNTYYDESAYKAVLKSDPLPRLPEGYRSYTVGLEFTPSDLR